MPEAQPQQDYVVPKVDFDSTKLYRCYYLQNLIIVIAVGIAMLRAPAFSDILLINLLIIGAIFFVVPSFFSTFKLHDSLLWLVHPHPIAIEKLYRQYHYNNMLLTIMFGSIPIRTLIPTIFPELESFIVLTSFLWIIVFISPFKLSQSARWHVYPLYLGSYIAFYFLTDSALIALGWVPFFGHLAHYSMMKYKAAFKPSSSSGSTLIFVNHNDN